MGDVRLQIGLSLPETTELPRWCNQFRKDYPTTYERGALREAPPTSLGMNYLAELRHEQESEEGSTADEGVPPRGAGWQGHSRPKVGLGYTERDHRGGESLSSPGRWPVTDRRFPEHPGWRAVAVEYMNHTSQYGRAQLLAELALGKGSERPFPRWLSGRTEELRVEELVKSWLAPGEDSR